MKKIARYAASAFGVYLVWVLILGLLLIEPAKNWSIKDKLTFSFWYGFSVAIEMARPVPGDRLAFCRDSIGKGQCPPLQSTTLLQHINSGRYKGWPIGPGIKSWSFASGNMLCGVKRRPFFTVSCRYAYDAIGPNGEDFFFCARGVDRCYFPELVGVRYRYG